MRQLAYSWCTPQKRGMLPDLPKAGEAVVFEPNPTLHTVDVVIATAVKSMSSFQDADAAFTADAPPLPATKPALALKRPARGRLRAASWQDDASNAAIDRGLFIARSCAARRTPAAASAPARCRLESRVSDRSNTTSGQHALLCRAIEL